MRIALVVIDDGLYTHRWVASLFQQPIHTIVAGACLSPFRAINFSQGRGMSGTLTARLAYYGPLATLYFGHRFILGRMSDNLHRLTGKGSPRSVRSIFREHGIPHITIPGNDINAPVFLDGLQQFAPDVLLTAFSQQAGPALRDLAPGGCLNIHFSRLPEQAGREPVFWSLVHGRGYGLTIYRMGPGYDTGDLLFAQSLEATGLQTLDAAIRRITDQIPSAVIQALANLTTGCMAPLPAPVFNQWPDRDAVKAFKRAGYTFI
ncbi:MAG: formyltransferase family protein [Planctomycetota bacterium]